MRALIALAALVMLAVPAWAMGWFPVECCSNRDCESIGADFIGETKAGWNIQFCSLERPICIRGFVARGKERVSQDSNYNICFNSSRIICFFVPHNA